MVMIVGSWSEVEVMRNKESKIVPKIGEKHMKCRADIHYCHTWGDQYQSCMSVEQVFRVKKLVGCRWMLVRKLLSKQVQFLRATRLTGSICDGNSGSGR